MIRSRISAMLLSGLFLLQLMLGGRSASMGMDMGMVMDTPDTGTQAAASMAPEVAPCSEDSPCHVPGAPNVCRSPAGCQTTVQAPGTKLADTLPPTRPGRPLAVEIRAPLTRLSPPESPPPRA